MVSLDDFPPLKFMSLTMTISFLTTFSGYHFAVVNVAEDIYKGFIDYTFKTRYGFDLLSMGSTRTLIWACTVVIYNVGGVFGSLSTSFFAEKYGRRFSLIIINNIIVIVSSLLMSLSKVCNSFEMLIIGRTGIGYCSGLAYGLLSVYLIEISPPKFRGFAASTQNLMVTLNSLMTLALALPNLLGSNGLWWALQGICIPFSIICMLLISLFPQTPKYLYLTKQDEKGARKSLEYFYSSISEMEIVEQLNHFKMEEEYAGHETIAWKDAFRQRAYRIPILISVAVNIAVIGTGIVVIFQYSSSMFETIGLSKESSQMWSILMSVCNSIGAFAVIPLIDRVGRRPLLLYGLSTCIVCDIVFMVFSLIQKSLNNIWPAYPALVAIFIHVTVFNMGPGAISWFLVSEMTPQAARSVGTTISTTAGGIAAIITNLAYPLLQDAIGPWAFLSLIIPCLVLTYILYIKLPETKNKPVDEIISVWFDTKSAK